MRKAACGVRLLTDFRSVGAVTLEHTSGGELTETVAYHVFRGIDTDKVLAVMNEEGVADKVGRDHGTA